MQVLKTISLATASIALAGFSSVALGNHVDFVVDGGFVIATTSTSGPVSGAQIGDPGNILGQEREVTLSFASGSGILSSGLLVPAGPGPVGPDTSKVILFDNSVGSLGTFTLLYDGIGNTGLGGVDFDTNWDAINVEFASVQGAGDLTVTVVDSSNNTGSATLTVNAAGQYFFLFTDPGYTGVNFNSVNSVEVELVTTIAASDFAISQITRVVVPEPTSLALLGLGGLTLLRRRR